MGIFVHKTQRRKVKYIGGSFSRKVMLCNQIIHGWATGFTAEISSLSGVCNTLEKGPNLTTDPAALTRLNWLKCDSLHSPTWRRNSLISLLPFLKLVKPNPPLGTCVEFWSGSEVCSFGPITSIYVTMQVKPNYELRHLFVCCAPFRFKQLVVFTAPYQWGHPGFLSTPAVEPVRKMASKQEAEDHWIQKYSGYYRMHT